MTRAVEGPIGAEGLTPQRDTNVMVTAPPTEQVDMIGGVGQGDGGVANEHGPPHPQNIHPTTFAPTACVGGHLVRYWPGLDAVEAPEGWHVTQVSFMEDEGRCVARLYVKCEQAGLPDWHSLNAQTFIAHEVLLSCGQDAVTRAFREVNATLADLAKGQR